MIIKIKKLKETATLPSKAHSSDAGMDLYCSEEIILKPNEQKLIPTDISMGIPPGFYGQLFDRSSMAHKNKCHVFAGVIDCSYRGPIGVVMKNFNENEVVLRSGDKIVQMVILPVPEYDIIETNDLDDTERGTGGFGSTGK